MPLSVQASRLARSVLQVVLAAISCLVASWLADESASPADRLALWGRVLTFALPIRAVLFWAFGLYTALWRYTSLLELASIAAAVCMGSLAIAVAGTLLGLAATLRAGFFVIDALLLTFLLGAVRILPRVPHDRGHADRKKVLIVGAGDAGAMILRDMVYRADSAYEPIGVIDDDVTKHGLRLHGVKVQGGRDQLPAIVRQLKPDEVLVSIPSADLSLLRSIVTSLHDVDIPIKTLPSIHELPECRVELAHIRPLQMEDLLSRPAVGLDSSAVEALIRGRRVLVTGAGGSIGSELCRQLIRWQPETLIVVERHENALFWLTNELTDRGLGNVRLVPALQDVTDATGIERLFTDTRPELVFHAAAHKHVPMLEEQVAEAVRNNILGTLTLARAAERHAVDRFVLISTDKAVNPVSVMGATKRVCELIVQTLMKKSRTRFCAVRFGNVLGSNGSVTLVFLRQIKAGGPVTVTHPDMRRYFMLISEAVELVTHAATLAERGTVYVLEMGEPIRIADLARQLIRLAGYRPDVDIPIEYTGFRRGERLDESLFDETEHTVPCETKGLFTVIAEVLPEAAELEGYLASLQRDVRASRTSLDLEALLTLIPRAESANAGIPALG